MANHEEQGITTYRAEGPDRLIEGLSDYIVLQAISSTTDTVNYQPTAKKRGGGWRLIKNGILNKAAPQHLIFQDNLKRMNPDNQTEEYHERMRRIDGQAEDSDRWTKKFQRQEDFLKKLAGCSSTSRIA